MSRKDNFTKTEVNFEMSQIQIRWNKENPLTLSLFNWSTNIYVEKEGKTCAGMSCLIQQRDIPEELRFLEFYKNQVIL